MLGRWAAVRAKGGERRDGEPEAQACLSSRGVWAEGGEGREGGEEA